MTLYELIHDILARPSWNNLWCRNYSSVRTNTRFTVPHCWKSHVAAHIIIYTILTHFRLPYLILYVPVNNFSEMSGRVFLCWTSTKQRKKCLAQGHNPVPPVRVNPTTHRSRVEPLRLLKIKISRNVWNYTDVGGIKYLYHDLFSCMGDNPLAKHCGLSPRTGRQITKVVYTLFLNFLLVFSSVSSVSLIQALMYRLQISSEIYKKIDILTLYWTNGFFFLV